MLQRRFIFSLGILVLLLWLAGISALLPAGGMILDGSGKPSEDAGKHMMFVSSFILLGTGTALLVYFQLSKHLVEPMASLERSIGEIRRGNLERPPSAPDQASAFGGMVRVINEMAAELKNSRGQDNDNLRRANIVNRAILEALPSPVFVVGEDGGVIHVNPAGESLSESLGVAGRLPAKIQHILDECRKNQSHYLPQDPREALVFRIAEEEVYFLPRIFRFDSEKNDSLSGWAVLLHNVSRIRWLDDMKTNLIATVSHEIKTPLTGIRMVLLLLLEERTGRLDPMQRTLVDSASADCERLLATLNSLLDLSRAESGSMHLSRVPLSLQSIIATIPSQFEGRLGSRGLDLSVEKASADFPKVLADPVRLTEVVNNLVSNAINHSPEKGEIVLRLAKPDGEHIRLSVIDQGPGVPEASQGRIFERFYRAPGLASQGLGLGLFISRDIMIAHEGRIGLSERSGNLTEFFIDVPIA
jgi:NtrC-family two-component system sensor histidine kinase KinB